MIVGVRLDFTITDVQWDSVIRYGLTVGALMVGIGYATKFYRGRFLVGSFDEALGLALHIGAVAVLGLVLAPALYPGLPRSIPVLVPPVALLICAAGRYLFRVLRERTDRSRRQRH